MRPQTLLKRRELLQRLTAAGVVSTVGKGRVASAGTVQQKIVPSSDRMRVLFFAPDGFNDKLVRRYLDDMPYTRRMMDEGFSAQVLPFTSTWGNINYNSMISGASPGIHYTTGGACNAETLWDVLASDRRKSMIFNFPPALPDASDMVGIVASGSRRSRAQTTVFGGVVFQTRDVTTGVFDRSLMQRTGWPPGGGPRRGRIYRYVDSPIAKGEGLETSLPLANGVSWRAVILKEGRGDFDRLRLYRPGETDPAVTVSGERWTPWVSGRFNDQTFHIRYRLLEISPDGTSLQLLASAGCPDHGFSSSESLEQLLKSRVGQYGFRSAMPLTAEDPYWRVGLEEVLDAELWVADAAGVAFEEWGAEFFMFKGSIADSASHNCATVMDPVFHLYDPAKAPAYDQVLREAYIATDRVIGRLLEIADRLGNTNVVVAGDHGICVNNVVCDINRRLQDAGLQTLKEDGSLDWSRSLAYTKRDRQGNEIYINLRGREPNGVVEARDYTQVQDRIVHTLLDWMDPAEQQRAITFALRKREARIVGYWGDACGDVIFAYNPGFTWGVNPDGSTTAMSQSVLANHGAGIPTQETGVSSNMGQLLAWGPKVRRGVYQNPNRQGSVTASTIGPTLAALLGCRPPAQADAAIIRNLLKQEL